MLALALLAVGALPMDDPCEIVQGLRSEVVSCTVSYGSATANGFTVSNPKFYRLTNESALENGMGGVSFDAGPAPADGYYLYGVTGVCINPDGSLERSSTSGMFAEQYPGHYAAESRDDGDPGGAGWVVAYNTSPCLAPQTRGAVLMSSYSEEEVGDATKSGWDGGIDQVTITTSGKTPVVLRYEILSAPNYHEAGTLTYRVLLVSGPGASGSQWCDQAASPNGSWNFNGLAQLCGPNQTTAFAGNNFGPASWLTFSLSLPSSFNGILSIGQYNSAVSDATYRLPGTPGAYVAGGSDGYTGQAFVVRDAELDAIAYQPSGGGFVAPSWACTDWDCVTSWCEGTGTFDVVGWLDCFFTLPEFEMTDLMQSLRDGVTTWEIWQLVDYEAGTMRAAGVAFGARDGQCGVLFQDFEVYNGITAKGYDTCTLPRADTVRTVAAAGIWLGIVVLMFKWGAAFITYLRAPKPSPAEGGE